MSTSAVEVTAQESIVELMPGTPIEVRCGYTRTWVGGFQFIGPCQDGCRILRTSDGVPLPVAFSLGDVRADR